MYFFYYAPIGINEKLQKFPSMTCFYGLLCVAVFVLNRYFAHSIPLNFYNLIYYPSQSGILGAMASAFLHFGYFHLISNLVYLLVFGRYVEDRMGPVLYTFLFFSASAVGNTFQGMFNSHVLHQPAMGIVGASGAIAGVLGAFVVRFYASRLVVAYWVFMPLQAFARIGKARIPAVLAVALWFILQAARSLIQAGGVSLDVAYITHIGGFLWGVAVAVALGQHRDAEIEVIWRRAQRYLENGQGWAAQGELIRYLARRPDEPAAVASLARAMLIAGHRQGASGQYRKACERLLAEKQRGRAEDLFREALRGFPDFTLSPDWHLDLAFGLERNLKPKLAVRAYENFERRYPFHKEAPFALLRSANLHWNTFDDADQAASRYSKLIAHYPEDEWVEFAKEQVRLLSYRLA